MAQNDSNNGFIIGFALIGTVALMMMVFLLIVIEVAAIAFAAFCHLFLSWRYILFGWAGGILTFLFLGQPIGQIVMNLHSSLDMPILIWCYQILPLALFSIGFIGAGILLDYLNDQRNLPTSEADFLAWRIRWGFTKGLQLDDGAAARLPHSGPTSQAFDVPPQDGA